MPILQANGINLYYEVHGSGPTVLLSHGVGSNHLHWWQQLPVLSKRFQVIVFDHRGFGFSTEDGKGPKSNVDDVIALLDHLSVNKVALIGQSMGGVTVTGVASRQPERVSTLILSCSGGGIVPVSHPPSMKGALAESKDYLEFARRALEQDGFITRHPKLSFLFASLSKLNKQVDIKLLASMRDIRHDPAPIVAAQIPTLLIGGEDDTGANAALNELRRLIPGSRMEIIPEAGHLLFFEAAQAYNALVMSYLDQHAR